MDSKITIENAWDKYLEELNETSRARKQSSWYEHFMKLAYTVAERSKDPRTQVGCVIATEDKIVASTGYNGIPRNVEDRKERMLPPQKYQWTAHAEENAVSQAARIGRALANGTAFVTHEPCSRCARTLIQAGITTVVIGSGVTNMAKEEFEVAQTMFREARVHVQYLDAMGTDP